jgi:SPP1 gp7 family putative phage head morphogenesis protein
MPDPVDLSHAFNLPPVEAIAYFKAKGYDITWNWFEIWQEAHTQAFTVAKAMRLDILQDIHNAVDAAIENGTTIKTFQKDLKPLLESKGWWGKTEEGAQLGSAYRLETIFRTNIQTAYSAGRYKAQIENADDRPYWQYIAILDNRVRPEHAAMNGLIFPANDPFWDTHYPPNGFNCRCRVRALNEKQVKGRDVRASEGDMVWEDQTVSGDIKRPVSGYKDPKTGTTIFTDPGWSYNPGKTAWKIDPDKYSPDVARLAK